MQHRKEDKISIKEEAEELKREIEKLNDIKIGNKTIKFRMAFSMLDGKVQYNLI